jgi:hypothetical protein
MNLCDSCICHNALSSTAQVRHTGALDIKSRGLQVARDEIYTSDVSASGSMISGVARVSARRNSRALPRSSIRMWVGESGCSISHSTKSRHAVRHTRAPIHRCATSAKVTTSSTMPDRDTTKRQASGFWTSRIWPSSSARLLARRQSATNPGLSDRL